ncbi:MAG: restriction endonuclease, partial [Ignavibacteria bacterium]|nr:restriction endonuclease [Ignavibacteria bacterium]
MSKPTKTINRIHFSDLDPIRFEDLSMQLVYRLTNWESLNHDGRSGSDNGVDIRGIEKIDEGERKFWAIQCKRYKKITSTELKKIVNEAIKKSNNPPNVLLIILACDVSQKLRETFENYSREMGIDEAIIWQASNLESKLYSDHPDLLFAFFGISINQKYNVKEQQIKKNLAVKRKLNKILQEYYVGNKIIIHSADDTTYPNCIETPQGKISPWFGLEYYGTYATGIEFRLTVYSIILERNPKD